MRQLTVHVVESDIICEKQLKWIPLEHISSVVVNGLGCRDDKEQNTLSNGHERASLSHNCAQRVQNKPFDRMIVQGAVSVWHVKSMMHRVNVFVKELVDVEVAMPKVLPRVENEAVDTRTVQLPYSE